MNIHELQHRRVLISTLAVVVVLSVALLGCGPIKVSTPTRTSVPPAPATPTILPRPTGVPGQWALRVKDSLGTNECGSWQCGPVDKGTKRTFSSGGYELSSPINDTIQGRDTRATDAFSSLYFQATVVIESGTNDNSNASGDVGLVLRLDNQGDDYIFDFDSDGYWELSSYLDQTDHETLLGSGTSDLFNTGAGVANVVGILAAEDTFTLFVNGNQIAQETDPHHAVSGKWIGFEVDAGNLLPADAVFSDVQVWVP